MSDHRLIKKQYIEWIIHTFASSLIDILFTKKQHDNNFKATAAEIYKIEAESEKYELSK